MRRMSLSPSSILSLNGLRCRVRLGWEAQERLQAQWVSFDIAIRFASLPDGARTDRIEGTVGYDQISRWMVELCAREEFRLLEKLGFQAYTLLRERIPACQIRVRVTKERPPIENLESGASFTVADWE